jgi:hypothetical protein
MKSTLLSLRVRSELGSDSGQLSHVRTLDPAVRFLHQHPDPESVSLRADLLGANVPALSVVATTGLSAPEILCRCRRDLDLTEVARNDAANTCGHNHLVPFCFVVVFAPRFATVPRLRDFATSPAQ